MWEHYDNQRKSSYRASQGRDQGVRKAPSEGARGKAIVHFARSYNNLLSLAKESMPDLDVRRWPPTIEEMVCDVRYTEIHVFLEQLSTILQEGYDHGL